MSNFGKKLGLLLVGGLLMLIIRVVFSSPTEHILPQKPDAAVTSQPPITLAEVAEKSKDALDTTTAYLQQEKQSLQSRMSVLQAKLDREIANLRAEWEQANQQRKQELNGKIVGLQEAKTKLVDMQGQVDQKIGQTTRAAWEKLKRNYNRMEMDLNGRIPPDDQPPQPAGADKTWN